MLLDYTYMRHIELSNSDRQKVKWQLQRARGSKEWGVIIQ